ncbi:MAG: hypothetical protein KJP04_08780 [Arenicella sp.]|nr:hypothetical protein [Arenicella sp.]
MIMKAIALAWLLFASFSESLAAQVSAPESRDVEISAYLIDLESIDSVTQSFVANLALVYRWHDPGLRHAGVDAINKHLQDIWHPRIQILNQRQLVKTFPEFAELYPDGEVVYRQRVRGSFSQRFELREFPFDSQRLEISLVNIGFGSQNINLKPSSDSGISSKMSISDWDILRWDFTAGNFSLDNESPILPGVVFSLDIQRDTTYFKFKAIMPLILIVIMSWLVFWIDPSLISSQVSVAVTAMLTVIAYRFALAEMLPKLPFLTSLDMFVFASTILVFLAMIEVVYTAHLSTNNQLDKARLIDRNARWLAPLIYLFLVIWTLVLRL